MNRHIAAAAHTSAQKRLSRCPAMKHFDAIESPTEYEVTTMK